MPTPQQLVLLDQIRSGEAGLRASLTDPPLPPPPVPTYTLSASVLQVSEGSTVTFTLRTTNVPSGTPVGYTIMGVNAADVGVALTGQFVVGPQGTAILQVPILADQLTEGLETLILSLERQLARITVNVLDTSTTPVPPPPAPAPPPIDPPPTPADGVKIYTLNVANTIIPSEWMKSSSTYERFQVMTPIDGDATVGFNFRQVNRTVGWNEGFTSSKYALIEDLGDSMKVMATADKPASGNVATLPIVPADYAHGWHLFTVRGENVGETCYPWPIFIRRDKQALDPIKMPVVRSSHDSHNDLGRAMVAWVPAKFAPITQPLPLRNYDHFSNWPMRRDLFMTLAAPLRSGDLYRPRRVKGVLNTANRQGYLVSEIHPKMPPMALLDGPRGRASISSPTFIMVGREDAQGYANLYIIDAGYRLVRMAPDGQVTTLVGWRHSGEVAANNDPPRRDDFDLIGDWSRIPVDRHGLHEAWQLTWDPRTTIKGSGTPIPNPPRGLEPVHPGSVVGWIADTQNDRVLRVTFRGDVHDVPPVIEEFITGLFDPWGVVFHKNTLIIAERTLNRLSRWNADTGEFIDTLVEGQFGFARLHPSQSRLATRLKSLTEVRAQACCMPECIRIQDDWVYYGGLASQDVKRVHFETKAWEPYVEFTDGEVAPAGAQYVTFDISDGTTGQRGTLFANFWSSMMGPVATVVRPDKSRWAFWDNGGNGPGMTWNGFGYGSAVGVGNGRIVCGWSNEGLGVIGLQRGEKTYDWDRYYLKATQAWHYRGLHLRFGPGGFGYYGDPLPRGLSADTDIYLEMHGL